MAEADFAKRVARLHRRRAPGRPGLDHGGRRDVGARRHRCGVQRGARRARRAGRRSACWPSTASRAGRAGDGDRRRGRPHRRLRRRRAGGRLLHVRRDRPHAGRHRASTTRPSSCWRSAERDRPRRLVDAAADRVPGRDRFGVEPCSGRAPGGGEGGGRGRGRSVGDPDRWPPCGTGRLSAGCRATRTPASDRGRRRSDRDRGTWPLPHGRQPAGRR